MTPPRRLTRAALRGMPLPLPDHEGDKESRGRVLVLGGSREIPGAALLAGTAALRAGAGKVAVATAASVAVPLALALPEARVLGLEETPTGGLAPHGVQRLESLAGQLAAVVVGPGMQDEEACVAVVGALLPLLADDCMVVLDAGAMSAVHGGMPLSPRCVVTPHAGEMAHLTGRPKEEIAADRPGTALRAAREWNVCVALKGAETVVALPDGTLWVHQGGSAGLGTSGSGDTLAGLMAGLGARGVPVLHAVLWAVRLHALAGEALDARRGGLGYLAREIPDEVPQAMQALCEPGEDDEDDGAAPARR